MLHLDSLLIDIAMTGDFNKIYEVHKKLLSIRGIVGERKIYEANYYLAGVVARFFQEHYSARLPFLIGGVVKLFLGRKLSLSKLSRVGKSAFRLTSDGINAYFQNLVKMGAIGETGPFSFDRLSKGIGVDWSKLLMTEVIPDIATMLALYLISKFISESFKESEESQQK